MFLISLNRSAKYRRVYIKESQRVKLTRALDPQTPIISKYTETIMWLQTQATLHEKEGMTQRMKERVQQGLEPWKIIPRP